MSLIYICLDNIKKNKFKNVENEKNELAKILLNFSQKSVRHYKIFLGAIMPKEFFK